MLRRDPISAIAWGLAALAFAYFAYFRVRFVGGCDSASYLAEALRLRGHDAGLAPDPSLPFAGAFVPICMVAHGSVVHSIFPPGFPTLLAAASFVGIEFYVTPLFGALSGLLVFFLARHRAGAVIALGLMVAWYAAPMTFWGSTQVMSDYVATALVLAGILAAERGLPLIAGLILGFALGVRPTCVLSVPIVALSVAPRAWRSLLPMAVGMAVAIVGWLVFVRVVFGSFDIPYAGNLHEMRGEHVVEQLIFLSRQTAEQYAPLVGLALVGLVCSPRTTALYALWFGLFLAVHSLWRNLYDGWWHLRFVASGLPAIVLAASVGTRSLYDRAAASGQKWPKPTLLLCSAGVLVVYAVWSFTFPHTAFLRQQEFDVQYKRDVDQVAKRVPPNAIIGAREHTIALRLYGHLQSFQWCNVDALALVTAALEQGRSAYVLFLFEDENGCPEQSKQLRSNFALEDLGTLPSGSRLLQIARRTE